MKEVLTDKLANFSNALKKLEDALAETGYSLSLDGTIKRFEFTFEMSWKALKKFLLYEGADCASCRDCLKKAYQLGFIQAEKTWLGMMNDRNASSHIYDESEAEKIYSNIKELYLSEFKKLAVVLSDKLEKAA